MNSNMNTRDRNKEHGDFIVIPIPSKEAEHVYKAESVFDHSKDSQGGSTPCEQDQDMSPGQRRLCTLGDVEVILSSGQPTLTGPQRRRSLSVHYRESVEQTPEDESIEHLSKPGTPSDRADSNSRGGERSDVLGKIVQNLQLASGEDSSSSQPREGQSGASNRGRYWSRRFTTI